MHGFFPLGGRIQNDSKQLKTQGKKREKNPYTIHAPFHALGEKIHAPIHTPGEKNPCTIHAPFHAPFHTPFNTPFQSKSSFFIHTPGLRSLPD